MSNSAFFLATLVELLQQSYNLGVDSFYVDVDRARTTPHSCNVPIAIGPSSPPRWWVKFRATVDDSTRLRTKLYATLRMEGLSVPRVCANREGQLLTPCGTGSVMVSESVRGKPFSGTREDRALLGKTIALMDQLLEVHGHLAPERPSSYAVLDVEEQCRISADIEGKPLASEFDRKILGRLTNWCNDYDSLTRDLMNQLGNQRVGQHIDLHPGNVLFDEESQIAWILDPDSLCMDWAFLSLAFAADRFSANRSDYRELVDFYHQGRNDVSLSPRLLASLVQFETHRRIMYLIRSHYFEKSVSWDWMLPRLMSVLDSLPTKTLAFL